MDQISRETHNEMLVKKLSHNIRQFTVIYYIFFTGLCKPLWTDTRDREKKSLNDSKLYNRTIFGRISDWAIKSIYDDEE